MAVFGIQYGAAEKCKIFDIEYRYLGVCILDLYCGITEKVRKFTIVKDCINYWVGDSFDLDEKALQTEMASDDRVSLPR